MTNNRIRVLREAQNMTQFELATRLGVQSPAVYKWERGRNNPSVEMALKLADVFGCSLDYLLGRDSQTSA